ncbi:MAG TPA: DUF4870 domain-containing protein [Puia sp.]|nr:DUF4870 domain-containing protein [Puia sp.]
MAEEYPLFKPSADDRLLAMLSHLLALVYGVGVLGPLVIYVLKKNQSEFVMENSKESLNFQLTVLILACVCLFLAIIFIGLVLFWVLEAANVVLVIMATVKASENKIYRYPINFRLVK